MSKFDQQSIENRIKTSLRAKSEWADLLFFGTNQRLISVVAEEEAQFSRYLEYLTRETKWSLARNVSSLLYQSFAHNYDPHRKVGAVGQVKVSADENFNAAPTVTIEIPKYTIFSTEAGVSVTSVDAANLVANSDNFVEIDVVQGEPKTFSTTALGNINEVVSVVNASIEDVYYEVFVNGDLWTEVDEIRVYDGADKVYQLRNKPDFSGVELVFGNNLNGLQLSPGDSIQFKYIETRGSKGNISQTGKVGAVSSTIYNTDDEIVKLYVTNEDPISGGEDTETLEQIRALSPLTFQAAERAITRNDYKAILDATPQVNKSTVWGAYEINKDAGTPGQYRADEENFVYVAAVSSSGSNLSETAKETLREYLQDFKSATDVVSFEDVEFVYLIFNTDIYVENRSLVLSTVKASVVSAIEGQYNKDTLDFGDSIPESDYQAFIDNISGVDYHDTVIELATFAEFNTAQFEAGFTLPLPEIKKSSITIYVKHKTEQTDTEWETVAVDDGSGGFDDGVSSYTVNPIGSAVNYLTGEVSLTISGGLPMVEFHTSDYTDYELKAEYQIVSNNFILQKRQQIFDLYETNVTIQYTE